MEYKSYTNYDLGGIKLLIIDDDIGLANSIRYFFEDLNCNVFVGYSGEGGLQLFIKEKPDIVIVDLNMPGMSGLDVIKYLSENYPDTPIVVVSGTGIIKEAIKSIKLGAWDFVTKPILNFEELEMSVLKALEKAQLLIENKNYKENLEKLVYERTEQLEKTVKELELAKEKLLAVDKLKNEFLGQISHEIRTPLNILLGYSEVLRMEFQDRLSNHFEDSYRVVTKATKRIIRTIELILQMSELVSGTFNLNVEDVELCEAVEEAYNKYYRAAEDKNLKMELSLPDKKLIRKIDRYSLDEIINQLIDNAIKFTDEGKVLVSVHEQNERIIVEITDTGIGISEDYLAKLYQPFSQEDQGYSRGYEGNGLGLSLVKKYCELNNIEIEAQSKKEEGSTFRIKLF